MMDRPKRRKKYRTIVVDPPWPYNDRMRSGNSGFGLKGKKNGCGAVNHYSIMHLRDIRLFGATLDPHVADDAHIYLWVTNAFIEDGIRMLRRWDWNYKTVLTWGKDKIGMGWYFRNNTEHLLFGVRGALPPLRRDVPTLFRAPRLAHSVKPDKAYRLIEMVSPGPRLDVFARKRREGWDVFGDEVEGSIEL